MRTADPHDLPHHAFQATEDPYTDRGLERWKNYDPVNDGDYAGSCLPFGMPRNINSPHGVQFVHHSDSLAMLFEQNTWFPWVPMDAGKWTRDLVGTQDGIAARLR